MSDYKVKCLSYDCGNERVSGYYYCETCRARAMGESDPFAIPEPPMVTDEQPVRRLCATTGCSNRGYHTDDDSYCHTCSVAIISMLELPKCELIMATMGQGVMAINSIDTLEAGRTVDVQISGFGVLWGVELSPCRQYWEQFAGFRHAVDPKDTWSPNAATESALKEQVGGNHYSKLAIQPVDYIHKNKIPFIEGNVIKYVTRWRDKGGIKDLQKAKHFIELLIELENGK